MHVGPLRRGSGEVLMERHRHDAPILMPLNCAVHNSLALPGNGSPRLVVNRSKLIAMQHCVLPCGILQLVVEFVRTLQIVMLSGDYALSSEINQIIQQIGGFLRSRWIHRCDCLRGNDHIPFNRETARLTPRQQGKDKNNRQHRNKKPVLAVSVQCNLLSPAVGASMHTG
ncbi:hypothetical protein D3C75_744420 [compost metagenome]